MGDGMNKKEYKEYMKFWDNPKFPKEFLDWIDSLFPEFKNKKVLK